MKLPKITTNNQKKQPLQEPPRKKKKKKAKPRNPLPDKAKPKNPPPEISHHPWSCQQQRQRQTQKPTTADLEAHHANLQLNRATTPISTGGIGEQIWVLCGKDDGYSLQLLWVLASVDDHSGALLIMD